jgi:hypothetical protein
MDGRVQNLNRVAMDWGSAIRFVRRVVVMANLWAAEARKDEQKADEPKG